MAYKWVCNTCGQLHGSNPSQCRSCGSTVLTPVSRSRVSEHADNPADVESLDPNEILTYGSTPDPEFPSSPDVAPDGSVGSPETASLADEADLQNRRRGYSPFIIIAGVVLLMVILLFVMVSL